jgi:hypothetical protein
MSALQWIGQIADAGVSISGALAVEEFRATTRMYSARRNLILSWSLDFVIDNFSGFRKRLGRG